MATRKRPRKPTKKGKMRPIGKKNGKGAGAECTLPQVCKYIGEFKQVPPYPRKKGESQLQLAEWTHDLYAGYMDLYEAVRRLEKMVHLQQSSYAVGGPVITKPPQPGNPPDKAGAKPPPEFPPP